MIARTVAPAKLNLALDVGALRDDGYHDLRSVFVAIDLQDRVSVAEAPEDALTVVGLTAGMPAQPGDNLALRAVRLLRERVGIPPVAVAIEKRIPAAGGLGGGSSDAAAVIRAADVLFGLGLDAAAQAVLGAELGSDVPFFAYGGAALVEGRGERVTPLADVELSTVVAAGTADLPQKTRELFRRLDAASRHPTDRVSAILRAWPRVGPDLLGNDFELVAFGAFPSLASTKDLLEQCGATAVRLGGAGPALFALCSDASMAVEIRGRAERRGLQVAVTRTLSREESTRVEVA